MEPYRFDADASGVGVVYANPLTDTTGAWRNRAVSDEPVTIVPQTADERERVALAFFGPGDGKRNQRAQFVARMALLHDMTASGDEKKQKEYPFSPVVNVPNMNRAPKLVIYGDGVVRLTTEQPTNGFNGMGLDRDYRHDLWAYGMFDASEPGRDVAVDWQFEPFEGKNPGVLPRIRIQTSARHTSVVGRINLSRLVRMHASQMYFNYRKERRELDRDPTDICRRLVVLPDDPENKKTVADYMRERRTNEWFREFGGDSGRDSGSAAAAVSAMPTQAEHDAGIFEREQRVHSAPVYTEQQRISVTRPVRINGLWWTIVLNDTVKLVLDIADVRPEGAGEDAFEHIVKEPYVNYTSNLQLIARGHSSVTCVSRVALANLFVNLYDSASVDMGGDLITDTLRLFVFSRTCRFRNVRVTYIAYGAIPPDCGSDAVALQRVSDSDEHRYAMLVVSARLAAQAALSSCASRIRVREREGWGAPRPSPLGTNTECGGNYPECYLSILRASSVSVVPNDNTGVQNRVRRFWELLLSGEVDAVVPFFDQLIQDKERMLFPIEDGSVRARIARPPFKAGKERKNITTQSRFDPYHKWLVLETENNDRYVYVRIGSLAWGNFVSDRTSLPFDGVRIDDELYASLVHRNSSSGFNNGDIWKIDQATIRTARVGATTDAAERERSVAFVPPGARVSCI